MVDLAQRRRPPIALSGDAGAVGERFAASSISLDERALHKLGAICPLDVGIAARNAAGRDWWPISLHWALAGKTGTRPAAVAQPRTTDEVAAVLRSCNEMRIPVTPAAGRSGVTGGAIPVHGGVALDLLALSGVTEVEEESGLVTVRCGTYGPELAEELATSAGLTIGHWPQSIDLSTVGGWLACRAVGQYSTRYGKIEDIVAGLEVVLADGTVVRTGALQGAGPRSATGPDLTQLFVGSEGTLGVITTACLRAWPLPATQRRAAWAFPTFAQGLEALRSSLRRGATPAVVRLHDATEAARSWGVENGHLLIALDEGEAEIVNGSMAVLQGACAASGATVLDSAVVGRWLEKRNDVSELTGATELGIVADTVEVSARWSELADLYDDALARLQEVPGNLLASAHASHSYPDGGCLYFTFAGQGDGDDLEEREVFYRASWSAVMDATRHHRGSISHHHGIGLVRAPYLAAALGEGFGVLVSLKRALDPNGILNPGKLAFPDPFGPVAWPGSAGSGTMCDGPAAQ